MALFPLAAVLLDPTNWVGQSNLIVWRRKSASSFCFTLQEGDTDDLDVAEENLPLPIARFWPYWRMLQGKEKETSLSLLTTWEMSLQLLDVDEQTAELQKVITLFAFFNPLNIGERLCSNDADDDDPMSNFKDDGH